MSRPVRLCSVEDCGKKHVARGLCGMHYRRWYIHGDPSTENRRKHFVCTIDGCEQSHTANGLCHTHDTRRKRHGDPLTVLYDTRTPLVKFIDYVSVQENGCWEWTGPIDSATGYAILGAPSTAEYRAKVRLAHQFAHETFRGPVPQGFHVDHLCHTIDFDCTGGSTCLHRRCVNPTHLEAVTPSINIQRAFARRR